MTYAGSQGAGPVADRGPARHRTASRAVPACSRARAARLLPEIRRLADNLGGEE